MNRFAFINNQNNARNWPNMFSNFTQFCGADKNTINSFTTKSKYRKFAKDKSNNDKKADYDKCTICLSEFSEDEDIR